MTESIEIHFFKKICKAFQWAGLLAFLVTFLTMGSATITWCALVFSISSFLSLRFVFLWPTLHQYFVFIQQFLVVILVILSASETGGLNGPMKYSFFLAPIISLLCAGTWQAIIWCVISLSIIAYGTSSQHNILHIFMYGTNLLTLYTILGYFRKMLELNHESEKNYFKAQMDADMEIKRLQKDMEESTKHAFLGTQLQGILHELNNPLTAIKGGVSVLEKKGSSSAGNDRLIAAMKRAAERCASLARSVQDYSRTEDAMESIHLIKLIQDAENLLIYEIKDKKIALTVDCPETVKITCRASRMVSVFLNLISNSRDAFEDLKDHRDRQIDIKVSESEDAVIILYSDNAGGMSEEVQKKIFEHLFTTKKRGKGTGIGMHLCKEVIEESNGIIEVSSTEGEGTQFTITIYKKTKDKSQETASEAKKSRRNIS